MVDFRPDPSQKAHGRNADTIPERRPVSMNNDHKNSVDALSANPVNRGTYASGSHDLSIKLWDANTHSCKGTMTGHTDGIWSLNYLADGRSLITSSADGTARIWDVAQGKCTTTLNFHASKVYSAAVNQDMSLAVTTGADNKVAVWDLRNIAQPLFVNEESDSSVTCCDFTNDQKAVVTANFSGRVNILDLESRVMRCKYDIMVLTDPGEEPLCYHVRSVKGHPGGNAFILSTGVGIPNLITYEGWHDEPLQRLETIGKYFGHSGAIRCCEFSPNLSQMVSCCMDGSVRIWDNATCDQKFVLNGHTDVTTSACWLSESVVVTGSWDCKIAVWDVSA